MNETIGVKGGKNDRRRRYKITKERKKRLAEMSKDEEIKELERKVKKQQTYTLVRVLPIVIAGQAIKTLYETKNGKPIDKEEEYSKWRIKEYDADISSKARGEEKKNERIMILPDGKKVTVYVEEEKKKTNFLEDLIFYPTLVSDERKKEIQAQNIKLESIKGSSEEYQQIPKGAVLQVIQEEKKDNSNQHENTSLNEKIAGINELSEENKKTLEQLKEKRIVSEYENQLKDVRYELRALLFEYNVLRENADDAILSDEVKVVLDRLTDLISSIEKLKSKIKIDDYEKYDNNYIYTLVENYFGEFKDGKLVNEIKDSPLYIMIAEKLRELENHKENLNKNVVAKKEQLEEKEERFEELKKRYSSIDKINKLLLDFQEDQDRILKDLEEKVKNAVSVEEQVRVEYQMMNRHTRRFLGMMALQTLIPGPFAAFAMAAGSMSYINAMRQMANPRTITRRYEITNVIDYSNQIKNSISSIDDAMDLLNKTSKQINQLIKELEDKFGDYLGEIKECDAIISNLKKISSELKEKEYEMEKTKEQQEKLLESNNAKIKKRGTREM